MTYLCDSYVLRRVTFTRVYALVTALLYIRVNQLSDSIKDHIFALTLCSIIVVTAIVILQSNVNTCTVHVLIMDSPSMGHLHRT